MHLFKYVALPPSFRKFWGLDELIDWEDQGDDIAWDADAYLQQFQVVIRNPIADMIELLLTVI